MDATDADLVDRTRKGEAAAFDELVRRHRSNLVRLIGYLTGDFDEAENLAQETLTRAFAQLDAYSGQHPFSSWLNGIAVNLSRTYHRNRSRHARIVAPENLLDAPAREGRRHGALSEILRRETREAALLAIHQLPEPFKEAFVLHFLEDLDYREMSQITGLAEGTLRVRAHRARLLLRGQLGSVVDTWWREPP